MLTFYLLLSQLAVMAKTDAESDFGTLCNDSFQANGTIRSLAFRVHKSSSSLISKSSKMHKKPWLNHAGMIKVRYSCKLEHYAARDSRWCNPYELKTSACVEVLRTKIPMAQVHTALSAIKQAVSIWILNPSHEDKKYGPFLRMLNGWKTAIGCAVNECSKHGGYWNVVCRYATICTPKSRKLYTCFDGKRCEKHKRPRKKTKLSPFGTNNFIVNFTGGFVRLRD